MCPSWSSGTCTNTTASLLIFHKYPTRPLQPVPEERLRKRYFARQLHVLGRGSNIHRELASFRNPATLALIVEAEGVFIKANRHLLALTGLQGHF